MLKVGVIGLGIGEQHLTTYIKSTKCKVVAICDFNENKLKEIHSKYNKNIKAISNPNDLILDPDINLISIASWDNFHAEQVLLALNNKKHVFVEKPLCLNETELQAIWQATQNNPQLSLGTNFILRLAPRFAYIKNLIEDGKLGNVISLEGDYNYGRLEKIINGWRGSQPGYSSVFGGGIHLIDLILWFSNQKVKKVVAFGGNIATSKEKFKNFDYVNSMLYFENGSIGKMSVNLGCVYPHFHKLSLYGSKLTVENSFEGLHLYDSYDLQNYDDTNTYQRKHIDLPYPGIQKGAILEKFIDEIYEQKANSISIKEIFNTMSVCLAIEKSAHSGKIETVNYF
jgi:predicted dehydrogenase